MKNLLAYTPEPFDNLELENFEYEPVSSEGEMEDEGPRRGKRVPQLARRIAGRGRMPLLSKRVRQIKPSFRPRIPVIPFAPPRIGSAASVNVFPSADDRRPSGQSSSSGNAGGEGSFANAPAQDVSSEHIRWVQETLNRALGLRLMVDGIMNKETRSAVRMFQERKGLPVTGLVGPDTEEALRAEGGQAAAEPELLEGEWEMPDSGECSCGGREIEEFVFEVEPFGGAEFEQWEGEVAQNSLQKVRWIQESLNKILGLRLKVDGIMGPQTKSAIRSFQQKNGLAADGIVGPKTEAALSNFDIKRPPVQPTNKHPIKLGETTNGLIHTYTSSPELQDKLLYDFDINDTTLKPAHKAELNNLIKFMADDARRAVRLGKRWMVSIDGYASRTGSSEWNKELSRQRMYSVNDYIRARLYVDFDLAPYVDFNTQWHGFEQTTIQGENPFGRSVRTAIHRPHLPPPPPVPPERIPCNKSKDWQIRVLGVFSAGIPLPLPGGPVLAGDCALFEINDLTNNRIGYFYFLGAGVAIGVKLPPVTPTVAGPYRCFSTNKPVCLENFQGQASFGQPPTIGPLSAGPAILGFEGPIIGRTSWGQVGTNPKYIPIQTGSTIGLNT